MDDASAVDGPDEIAIIGMAGRFPGAGSIAEFWQNLRDGVESVSFFSDEELLRSGVTAAALKAPNYVKARAMVEGVEMFDASFFGFNPREAEIMDPQQRFFLESAWEALECAGYNPDTFKGSIGVYAGTNFSGYLFNVYSNPEILKLVGQYRVLLGNDKDYLATLTSYKLNLKGPSVSIQTACSTSLVAVHLACQSLLDGECDLALAGGVAINLPHKAGYFYEEGGIASPDGHCRTFDARAEGTISGSGVGIVVLKRLSEALADGDSIHATIKASAVNNDGALKAGYTAPSEDGQAEVIAEAITLADIAAESITYVEAHGTATPLGDPIEVSALTKAFRSHTAKTGFCAIGSVKTNIGHLDAAAGVAGLIKAVLALMHKKIPPSLHYEKPNPQIDFAKSPFYVNTKLTEWAPGRFARRAGVSSFGIGGTNAHAILEEAPARKESGPGRSHKLLVLSAKTGTALDTMSRNLAEHLSRNEGDEIADIAFTLQVGRKAFSYRRVLVCRDRRDAAEALETMDPERRLTNHHDGAYKAAVFMFSGQGSQHVNMGLELYESEELYREQVDICSEILKPHLGLDIRRIIYPDKERINVASAELNQTCMTQPALFVLEYALARLWMEWGIRPEAMIGHSVGEYVAACIAGVLSLDHALSLVAARGKIMQRADRGRMLAVGLAEKEVEPLLGAGLSLAAVNGPELCVMSGGEQAIDELAAQLEARGIFCRQLETSHAFHSHMMDPLLRGFADEVKKVELNAPKMKYISNVTGKWMRAEEATSADYWVNQLRRTVRFSEGLEELKKLRGLVLLEVGPGQALQKIVKQQLDGPDRSKVFSSLPPANTGTSEVEHLLKVLGNLWSEGIEVDWNGFCAREKMRRVPLPTYPFERQRYWLKSSRTNEEGRQDSSEGAFSPEGKHQSAVENEHPQKLMPGESKEQSPPLLVPILDARIDDASSAHEHLFEQQLQIMSKQLELLRDQDDLSAT